MFGLDFLSLCGDSFFFCLTYLVLTVSVYLSLFNAISIVIIAKSLGIVEVCVTIFPSLRVVCVYVWPVLFLFILKF